MIKNLTAGFDSLMRKYTPDPFIYALVLTIMAYGLGLLLGQKSALELAKYWGKGFWTLNNFTMQMVMILFLGYIVALSPLIKKFLSFSSALPKNLPQAAVYTTLISLIGSLLNWGFGLIISALYCKELGRRFNGRKFPILVACSYSGFLVWHGGISGSIPLVVSTPGNFSEALIGGIVPLEQTIFSTLNLAIVICHFIFLPLLNYFLMKYDNQEEKIKLSLDEDPFARQPITSPAEKWENSVVLVCLILVMAALCWIAIIKDGAFSLDLNQINFFLFIIALVMHKTPSGIIAASKTATQKIWPILIQYPFYAGIMVIMQESGLAEMISQIFVDLASAKTLPVLVYWSAGLINIFIPSGGGQWAVQGPMVIKAAQHLSADLNASMMAVAWGDAWTNMIQPFWALPLLAIAGLKARDIMSSLVYIFLVSGVLTTICFLLLV
jgi:short-chain fatty acids transporter